jgi:hypothetical protein
MANPFGATLPVVNNGGGRWGVGNDFNGIAGARRLLAPERPEKRNLRDIAQFDNFLATVQV